MDDRTEAPTAKRRSEARQKGQVAKSVEVNTALLVLMAFWLLNISGGRFYQGISLVMHRTFSQLPTIEFTPEVLFSGMQDLAAAFLWILAPFALPLMLAGVVANVIQTGLFFSGKVLKPEASKINPVNGFKKIFSTRGMADLLKSIIKVLVVGSVIYITVRDNFGVILASSRMDLSAGVSAMAGLTIEIGFRVAAIMVVLAFIDYFYQKYEHEKSLKMTKQEVREEAKQQENPQLKGRIRSRQRQLAMSRMMAAIPEADVVITNPTHYAVALKYEQGTSQAPVVLAKGQRLVAQRIKNRARENNVPLVENKPLARSLFKSVEVGQAIPVELYKAVAEVLAFVYRLKPKGRKLATGRREA
ncbi:MAG: flagellar biosynthesis protein FlhB [Chloroflexi bacterium]|nr:MAG: flagellar biosynthesis protein FlhB [Chloroflexota bacterium]